MPDSSVSNKWVDAVGSFGLSLRAQNILFGGGADSRAPQISRAIGVCDAFSDAYLQDKKVVGVQGLSSVPYASIHHLDKHA